MSGSEDGSGATPPGARRRRSLIGRPSPSPTPLGAPEVPAQPALADLDTPLFVDRNRPADDQGDPTAPIAPPPREPSHPGSAADTAVGPDDPSGWPIPALLGGAVIALVLIALVLGLAGGLGIGGSMAPPPLTPVVIPPDLSVPPAPEVELPPRQALPPLDPEDADAPGDEDVPADGDEARGRVKVPKLRLGKKKDEP